MVNLNIISILILYSTYIVYGNENYDYDTSIRILSVFHSLSSAIITFGFLVNLFNL